MQGNYIEISLHHHGTVGPTNRISGLIEAKQIFSLFKHLRFRGIQIFGFAAIQAATTKTNDPPLAIVDRHHQAMAETVIEPLAPLPGHHQSRRLQLLNRQLLHLLQIVDQAIPALRGIAQLKALNAALIKTALLLEVGQGSGPLQLAQVAPEPAAGQGQHAIELLPAGELLPQAFLLGGIKGFHRQRITPG